MHYKQCLLFVEFVPIGNINKTRLGESYKGFSLKKWPKVVIFQIGICRLISSISHQNITRIFLISCLICNQIWLSPLVDDHQPTYLRNVFLKPFIIRQVPINLKIIVLEKKVLEVQTRNVKLPFMWPQLSSCSTQISLILMGVVPTGKGTIAFLRQRVCNKHKNYHAQIILNMHKS